MTKPAALAIAAHPDDIEFMMAGTLLLLRDLGWEIHVFNVSTGSLGSTEMTAARTRTVRRKEAQAAAAAIGARWHPPIADDLEIVYSTTLLRKVAAVVRRAAPTVVLTHAPADYMEDHMETCRLAVTAAFARGIPNFRTDPPLPPYAGDVTVYHAMPHMLCDPLGQRVYPEAWVDITGVMDRKRSALACHSSQKEWLDATQGLGSFIGTMESFARQLGSESGRFAFAEGWRRHLHVAFCARNADPLADALGSRYRLNPGYPHSPGPAARKSPDRKKPGTRTPPQSR